LHLHYFDLGLHKDAAEIDMFISICKNCDFKYTIYGFEAHPEYCHYLSKKYSDDVNVNIINKAISYRNGKIELYIAEENDGEGNSIFRTKKNVNRHRSITVDSVLFSYWLFYNVPNFQMLNNILRFNIEGAEWYLINDLNNEGLLKYFRIIMGSSPDIPKVSELSGNIDKYNDILKSNSIQVQKFTKIKKKTNCDLESLIKRTFIC
jgi:FkbM family methyltransferase